MAIYTFNPTQIKEALDPIYELCKRNMIDDAINYVYKEFGDAIIAGEFKYVNDVICEIDVAYVSVDVLRIILLLTKNYDEVFYIRSSLVDDIKCELCETKSLNELLFLVGDAL